MKLIQFIAVFGIAALTGCAHSTMRGSVAMKASDSEAHVCMGEQEVRVGDKVVFFKNVCPKPKSGVQIGLGDSGGCRKEKVGDGSVTRILNDHYSVVQVSPDVKFEEGNIVEKL